MRYAVTGVRVLDFRQHEEKTLLLPERCSISLDCLGSIEVQQAVASFIQQSLHALALSGMDLRALDGVTIALDTRKAACGLQDLPEGVVPLEMNNQPGTMELARTVAVRRGDEFRFHIVLRAGLGLVSLSTKPGDQNLARGCIAHEAAHVEHEGHLYRTFPHSYGRKLDCGDRSRQTFIKAIDVWSEYAACRSSAQFRPETTEDFDPAFCLSLAESHSASERWTAGYRRAESSADMFREIQEVLGDTFIRAGYLLGHRHGLEFSGVDEASNAGRMLRADPPLSELVTKLETVLQDLWNTEFVWQSMEVFVPIYDLLCELMALHGMAFVRHGDEWRIIQSDKRAKLKP